jgi:hypothetical protein
MVAHESPTIASDWIAVITPSTSTLLPTYGNTPTPSRRSRRQTIRSLISSRTPAKRPNQRQLSVSMKIVPAATPG